MAIDLSLVTAQLRAELAEIGITAAVVTAREAEAGTGAYHVTLVAPEFGGQTFLDREMRVRPVLTRVLMGADRNLMNIVVDALSPEEFADERESNGGPLFEAGDDEDELGVTRASKREWHETRSSILRAIERSQYDIEAVSERRIYVASRGGLTHERILLGFAQATRDCPVDIDIRREMQGLTKVQKFSATYYVAPTAIDSPFSNQTPAPWLQLVTPVSFLHALNSSKRLAEKIQTQCAAELLSPQSEQNGEVVEPTVRVGDRIFGSGFFDFVSAWAQRPEASLLVLVAPAGHGKTTMALELSRRLAAAFSPDGPAKLPLLLGFESVRRVVDFDALMYQRFAVLRCGAFGAFAELMRRNEAVLLVDGFDELAEDAGASVAEAQVRSMRGLLQGGAKIVLAGRSIFTQEFAGAQTIGDRVRGLLGDVKVDVVEVLPFAPEQIESYIDSRTGLSALGKEAAKRFALASPDHVDLCGNPLFLRMACSLAAADMMPVLGDAGLGVEMLVDGVCKREEDRQQLGLGVAGQLEFLRWTASEVFKALVRTGKSSIAQSEVKTIAGIICEKYHIADVSVPSRLAGHALLAPSVAGSIAFLHPYVRDVILAISLRAEGIGPDSPINHGDLPEGAIERAARETDGNSDSGILALMPAGWLSRARLPGEGERRRNAFRIAVAAARFKRSGNPREWTVARWLSGGTIADLALDGLVVESCSFSNVAFQECNFERSFFEDCDFRNVTFSGARFDYTLFHDCTFSGDCRVLGGTANGVMVVAQGAVQVLADSADLRNWIEGDLRQSAALFASVAPVVSDDAVKRGRALIAGMLRQLVDVRQGKPKFNRVGMQDFEHAAAAFAAPGRENQAVVRVLLPGLLASLCEVGLSGGSREVVCVEKRWHSATLQYVSNGIGTQGLEDVVSRLVTRAARYLS